MKTINLTDEEFTFLSGWLKKECRRTKQSVTYWSNNKEKHNSVNAANRRNQSQEYLEMVGPLYEKMKGI